MDISLVLGVEAPAGCPKILPELLVLAASDANPPLFANAENPPEAAGVLLPNTLLGFALLGEPNPDCPNAGVAEEVDPVAQGDGLAPRTADGWPKAGAAGLAPNGDDPNEGAPNFGADAAGPLPNELEPNPGVAVVDAGVAQGLGFPPRADGPPKAGVEVVEASKAVDVLAKGAPKAGVLVVEEPNGFGAAKAGALGCCPEDCSAAASPG